MIDYCYLFAGVLARSGKVKESVDLLLKDKKDDIDRILIAAQVLLEKGDVSGSIAILEKLPSSVKHRTGLLSSMVNFFLTFTACFSILMIFSNLDYNCSNLLDLRNLQEQVKIAFCYQKLF